ncbi:MAG: hypothetical protein JWM57_1219 [Phycisphaerales bacterium]|nr:hypothetical protein [Phycisphaerales bacterium]
MPDSNETMAEQIARAATAFQERQTGRAPTAVNVVLSGGTVVVTLHGALSPAEQALAKNPDRAAKMRDFHRQLFLASADAMGNEVRRITGLDVREADAELAPQSNNVVQIFSDGTMVQVFLLAGKVPPSTFEIPVQE